MGRGRGRRTRKGKLGSSKKGVRLTLFLFEEATARRRWEGHCQGLLWGGVCICRSGEVGDRAGWREAARLSESHRGVWIFFKPSFCRQDGCRSIIYQSIRLNAWRQKPHRKASAGRPGTLPQKMAPFSGACSQGSSPRRANAPVMLPADEVMGCVTSCPAASGAPDPRPQNRASL